MNLLQKLEEIKQKGAYSVQLYYGADIGADDLDIPIMEREVKVVCFPVGYLGSMRAMYVGTVKSLLELDLSIEPTQISNPPKKEEYEKEGFYCWGTETVEKLFKM